MKGVSNGVITIVKVSVFLTISFIIFIFIAIDTKCRPELHDLMNLLASIAPKYFIIGTGLNVPMDTLGLDPHPQHHVHNLSTTLKWWLDNGNNPLYNSSVTWYNIINVIKGPLVCKYEVARQMEEFLAKKTTAVNSK